MRITNPETREFLALNAPYWLGRIESAECLNDIGDSEWHRGILRTLGSVTHCLMGEIYGETYDYHKCQKCNNSVSHWLGSFRSLFTDQNEEKFMLTLDELVQHQIKCHKKPELKIPMELCNV